MMKSTLPFIILGVLVASESYAVGTTSTCESLSETSCSVAGDEHAPDVKSLDAKEAVQVPEQKAVARPSMLNKADLTTPQALNVPPVAAKKQKKGASAATIQTVLDTVKFQQRADEITRQQIINNQPKFDELRSSLGDQPAAGANRR